MHYIACWIKKELKHKNKCISIVNVFYKENVNKL
jgi:hypothetical protein